MKILSFVLLLSILGTAQELKTKLTLEERVNMLESQVNELKIHSIIITCNGPCPLSTLVQNTMELRTK